MSRTVEELENEINELKSQLQDTQSALDEFQADSRELEAELEKELERANKKSNELELKLRKAESDSETLRERLTLAQQESLASQRTIHDLKQKNEELTNTIRVLEQQNDDLQRSERIASSSCADAESKLSAALEQIVLLEAEVEEKEALKVDIQRYKDDIRDMRLELELLKSKQITFSEVESPSTPLVNVSTQGEPLLLNYDSNLPFSVSTGMENQIDLVSSLLHRVLNIQERIQHCRKHVDVSEKADNNQSENGNIS